MTADCELRFFLGRLRGKQDLAGISASPGNIASPDARDQITLNGSLHMHTGETVSPLAAHKMQIFVAGHSAAFACISEEQRAGSAADRTGEDGGAVEGYGTVGMNYI